VVIHDFVALTQKGSLYIYAANTGYIRAQYTVVPMCLLSFSSLLFIHSLTHPLFHNRQVNVRCSRHILPIDTHERAISPGLGVAIYIDVFTTYMLGETHWCFGKREREREGGRERKGERKGERNGEREERGRWRREQDSK
jgi:hypothetical protein